MAQENIWRDQFMAELDDEETNRQLCQLAVEEMFESWSVETQEAVLEDWNDWQNDEPPATKPKLCCEECGKTFTRSHDLTRHIRSKHSGERPHACDACGKVFAASNALKRHQKIHQNKKYECLRCHKMFNRKDALNRHMKMHERRGAEREYKCNVCGEVFRNIFPFQAHQRDVHQVGAGKRKTASTTTRQAKRARTETSVNEGMF